MPLAETELASQPDRQHDKIAPKPKAPSQIEGFVEQHNYKWFFKASNAPVDPTQVEKVTVTVKLHAGHSADDGNRAVTSEVNRPAISPIVTVAAARRQRTPSWKSWVTQDSKTGKKLFLAKGLPRLKRLNEILVFFYEQYQYSPKALRELRMIGEALEAKVLKPTNLKGSRRVPYIFKAVKVSIASDNQ